MTSSEGRGDEQYGHLSDAQLDLYDRMSEISEDRKRGATASKVDAALARAGRKLAAPHQFTRCTYHPRMTTYFISRHPGAIEWAALEGLQVDQYLAHLNPALVQRGDTVIGNLPVHLAAQVCAVGARYLHLSMALPAELRGRELSAQEMVALQASIEPFQIHSLSSYSAS